MGAGGEIGHILAPEFWGLVFDVPIIINAAWREITFFGAGAFLVAADSEVGDFSRFFPVSQRPVPEMLAEMDGIIASLRDPWIRRLLEALFLKNEALRSAFALAPAAKSMHHASLGGLLEHTLSILAMADRACGHYAAMNRDLVVAGVFLHDVGKTAELSYQRSFGYTDAGGSILVTAFDH